MLDFTTDDYDRAFHCRPKSPRIPDVWQLEKVSDIAWTQDDSGVYVYINWIWLECKDCKRICADCINDVVRLDIMHVKDDMPVKSFVGAADNVRKAVLNWLQDNKIAISLEHAGYIGAEIERADTERIDYVQD